MITLNVVLLQYHRCINTIGVALQIVIYNVISGGRGHPKIYHDIYEQPFKLHVAKEIKSIFALDLLCEMH